MQTSEMPATTWEAAMPRMSDEGLLLAELSHRVRNEVCASIGAMRLSLSRSGARHVLAPERAAIGRLEAFGELLGVMSVPPGGTVHLRPALERMCESLKQGRTGLEQTLISVDATDLCVAGDAAQRIMMIAHELVHNAMRHALEGRRGLLAVVLRGSTRDVRLAVIDDGPGIRRGSGNGGSGMGSPIVAELVRRGGGSIDCRSGVDGTRVRVRLPGTPVITAFKA
jgi:two-component sensor histidine kinase